MATNQPAPDLGWSAQQVADEIGRLVDLYGPQPWEPGSYPARMADRIPPDVLDEASRLGLRPDGYALVAPRAALNGAFTALRHLLNGITQAAAEGDHDGAATRASLVPSALARVREADEVLAIEVTLATVLDGAVLDWETGRH